MVRINSTSGHEAAIRQHLLGELRRLGCRPSVDKKGNIHAVLTGALAHGPTILFNAHMDTVVPGENVRPKVLSDRIVSDGTTILGADDKAGLAGILEMLALLQEKNVLFHKIKIILTVEEEIGLRGAKALLFPAVRADYCFVLDSDGAVGSIVNQSPAQEVLTFKVRGKSAHAGLNPEDGVNAIKIAGLAISQIPSGRLDGETTANVGSVRGGTASNIVPDETIVVTEARSRSEKKLQKQVRGMLHAFRSAAKKLGGSVEIERRREYEAIKQPKNSAIVRVTKIAARRLGLPHTVASSGGGSDASIIFGYGVPTVGLGIGMENVHSKQEYITLRNLTVLPQYLLALLEAAHDYERRRRSK
ncbi:peptidase T [Candidatus Termititenax persephonae]|uniref:Peptidase T n=1 Tax=Candidatus Termititenax persephonae TaxID=2218525 RepID=A0A388TIM0_9BACT|nr:peptidase T [Candidatus Termititenax persephonae]